jgi:hypothetical protein
LGSVLFAGKKEKPVIPWAGGILAGLLALAAAWFLFTYEVQFRCLPLIAVVVVLLEFFRFIFGAKRPDPKRAVWLALSLFALLCLVRILLTAGTFHYGFCLALPGVLLFAAFWVCRVPEWFPAWIRHRPYFAFAFLGILLILSVKNFFLVSMEMYDQKTVTLEGPGGRMKVMPMELNLDLHAALEHLVDKGDEDDTLLVLPEGAMINFLTQQKNPTYYNLFIPPELNLPGVEDKLIAQIEANAVDRILVVGRPVLEYGFRGLGLDYGFALMAYIKEAYEEEASFGPPLFEKNYPTGCLIYCRKSTE